MTRMQTFSRALALNSFFLVFLEIFMQCSLCRRLKVRAFPLAFYLGFSRVELGSPTQIVAKTAFLWDPIQTLPVSPVEIPREVF